MSDLCYERVFVTKSPVLCTKFGLHITDDSCFAFRFSVCLDCFFINGCAGTVCV